MKNLVLAYAIVFALACVGCGASDSSDAASNSDGGPGGQDGGVTEKTYCGLTRNQVVAACEDKCETGYPCLQDPAVHIADCKAECPTKTIFDQSEQCICAGLEYWTCAHACPFDCSEFNIWGECGDACDADFIEKCPTGD